MHNNRLTILAINPGTRYIGIAVLRGAVLRDWSVRVVAGPLFPAKRQKITRLIDRLISDYKPDVIATKRLHSSRSSKTLDQLCHDIETTAIANSIRVERYSIQEVEHFFAPEVRINKRILSELLCQKHSVLSHELKKEQNNYNPYYVRVFEAVALGTMAEATIHDM